MDPITASSESSATPPVGLRQLWQVPLFVTGVLVLVLVVLTRSLARDNPRRQLNEHLTVARQLLEDGDAQAALGQARHAVAEAEAFPDRRGEAALLLGLAEARVAGFAEAGKAGEHWTQARKHLQEAAKLGVPEGDQGRLQYTLGKVGFHTGAPAAQVAACLAAAAESAPDRAEAYRLLTEAYLRLSPPDLEKALEANKKLRDVPRAREDVLAPARLVGGELLLQLKKPKEARDVLAKVGKKAPPEVLLRAHLLRARSYQDEGKWSDAAALYQSIRSDKRMRPEDPVRLLYDLGICYDKIEQTREATVVWEECVQLARRSKGPGIKEVGAAAALALAEAQVQEPELEKALDTLASVVRDIRSSQEWKNQLVDLAHARALFEQTDEACRKAGRFDLALRLAVTYDRLAAPGRAQTLEANAAAAWARSHLEQTHQGPDRERHEAEARRLFLQAAEACEAAVGLVATPAEKARMLWQSADHYRSCRDYKQAAANLERYLKLVTDNVTQARSASEGTQDIFSSAHIGEAWYLLGEVRRLGGAPAAAIEAYHKCIELPTPFAFRARFQLAMAAIAKGQLDDAESILTTNLKLMVKTPDPEAREKTVFALSDLLYRQHSYRLASRTLEDALMHFPENSDSIRARYQLADCYRQLAVQAYRNYEDLLPQHNLLPGNLDRQQKEYQSYFQKATDEFHKLGELIEKDPAARARLSAEQQVQVPFNEADCLFKRGRYQDALKIYERLAIRFPQRPEGLEALGGTARCYAALGDMPHFRQRVDNISQVLPATRGLDQASRQGWEKWLTQVRRQADR